MRKETELLKYKWINSKTEKKKQFNTAALFCSFGRAFEISGGFGRSPFASSTSLGFCELWRKKRWLTDIRVERNEHDTSVVGENLHDSRKRARSYFKGLEICRLSPTYQLEILQIMAQT